jgi:hypothetical protein
MRKEIKALVTRVAPEKGVLKKQNMVGFGDLRSSKPQFTLRKGDATVNVRMNKETMVKYFSMLKDVLMEHNMLNFPDF